MISVRRIWVGEGDLFKRMRLAALHESPASFSSTYHVTSNLASPVGSDIKDHGDGDLFKRMRSQLCTNHLPSFSSIGRAETSKDSPIEKMKRKFDTLFGRFVYNKRIAIVEPVFGNLRNKGMARFTLRGKKKVNTQW
jgi:hypothetical protein